MSNKQTEQLWADDPDLDAAAESYDTGNRAGYDDGYAGETVPPRMYRRADDDWRAGYDVGHEQGAADREAGR